LAELPIFDETLENWAVSAAGYVDLANTIDESNAAAAPVARAPIKRLPFNQRQELVMRFVFANGRSCIRLGSYIRNYYSHIFASGLPTFAPVISFFIRQIHFALKYAI
jgi:hypothetical protein